MMTLCRGGLLGLGVDDCQVCHVCALSHAIVGALIRHGKQLQINWLGGSEISKKQVWMVSTGHKAINSSMIPP